MGKKLCLMLSVCFSLAVNAENFDFSELGENDVHLAFSRFGQSARKMRNPATQKPSLKLDWDGDRFSRLELALKKTPEIKTFDQLRGEIRITVPPDCTARRLTFRIIDRENEVFQIPCEIPDAGKPGKKILHYTFRNGGKIHSWISGRKGRKNGRIDFPCRLFGFSLSYPSGSGRSGLYLDSIRYEIPDPGKSEKFSVRLNMTSPLYIIDPDSNENPELQISYTGMEPGTFDLSVHVSGFDGSQSEAGNKKLKHLFQPGGKLSLPLEKPRKSGIWYVRLRAVNCAEPSEATEHTSSFAVMKPSGLAETYSHDDFRFGVCSHPNWINDPERWRLEAKAMRTAGIRYLRCGISMQETMPKRDVFRPEKHRKITDIFREQGVERVATLGYSPKWALEQADKASHPRFRAFAPLPDAWRNYVGNIFRLFKGKIHFYEIWNEVDHTAFCRFDAKTYANLAKIAAGELAAIDPSAKLMSSGFAAVRTPERGNFMEQAMREAGNCFSIHCFHGHGPFLQFAEMVDMELLPMRERLNITYPWYAHETALTSTGYGETVQAAALWKKLLFSWARGSIGYTWYNLVNKGTDPDNAEHNYGLLTSDFHPKAAYVACNTLTSLFGRPGTRFLRQYKTEPGTWIFEFRNGKNLLIAAWSEHYGIRNLLLHTDAEKAEVIDMMGNPSPAEISGRFTVLPIAGMPVVLRLSRASLAEQAPQVLELPETLLLAPGERKSSRIILRNPENRTAQLSIRLQSPQTLRITPDHITLRLAPEETVSREIELTASRKFRSPAEAPAVIRFAYELNGLKLQRHFPVHSAHLIGEHFPAVPNFVLDRRDQVHSRFDADPSTLDRLWSSPADLSANIFTAASGSTLKLRVEVRDDVHRQPYQAAELWKGDSIQFYFQFPGQGGCWELGLARGDDGSVKTFCWRTQGNSDTQRAAAAIHASIERKGTQTLYNVEIPLNALNVDAAVLRKGFRFNLLVNDDDLGVREGWIHLAPGVGRGIRPRLWPWIMLRK